ncbi:MmgE/PrpD family protein [Nocardioides sp.]|uniref:MmgE/PrpD family protein n=1 Tax=Nocardioides sp. TaxID=35761 RepID=UPI0039E6D0CE
MTGLVASLGGFVSGLRTADIPPDVLEKARLALVHNLSVAVAGNRLAEVADQWSRRRWGGSGAHTLISGLELAPPDAAFANACLIHARAQDDVYFPGLTHVGAATTPAVLALAEAKAATLGDALTALVAGYEVAAAVSAVAAPLTTSYGFRASGIYGGFGAAAAAASLLRLDPTGSSHAIAIAGSFASGTNQTWVDGSLEWQLQLGAAARSGIEAASLAASGGTGAAGALEGGAGFFAAFARDAALAAPLSEAGLGEVWRTRDVTFKPYPVCAILQAPVAAATELHERVGRPEFSRASIRLAPAEAHYPGTDGTAPFDDAGAALMSASYCLTLGLVQGDVTADDLFRSHEEALQHLSRRLEVVADPTLAPRCFVLEVEYPDGHAERVERDGGSAFNWPREELLMNVERLKREVPAGIDLDRLAELAFGDLGTQVAEIVDTVIAS